MERKTSQEGRGRYDHHLIIGMGGGGGVSPPNDSTQRKRIEVELRFVGRRKKIHFGNERMKELFFSLYSKKSCERRKRSFLKGNRYIMQMSGFNETKSCISERHVVQGATNEIKMTSNNRLTDGRTDRPTIA